MQGRQSCSDRAVGQLCWDLVRAFIGIVIRLSHFYCPRKPAPVKRSKSSNCSARHWLHSLQYTDELHFLQAGLTGFCASGAVAPGPTWQLGRVYCSPSRIHHLSCTAARAVAPVNPRQ